MLCPRGQVRVCFPRTPPAKMHKHTAPANRPFVSAAKDVIEVKKRLVIAHIRVRRVACKVIVAIFELNQLGFGQPRVVWEGPNSSWTMGSFQPVCWYPWKLPLLEALASWHFHGWLNCSSTDHTISSVVTRYSSIYVYKHTRHVSFLFYNSSAIFNRRAKRDRPLLVVH